MPINLETINSLFNKNFNPKEASLFLNKITKKYKKQSYKNFEEKAKSQIGEKLYAAFIKNYTKIPNSIFKYAFVFCIFCIFLFVRASSTFLQKSLVSYLQKLVS